MCYCMKMAKYAGFVETEEEKRLHIVGSHLIYTILSELRHYN